MYTQLNIGCGQFPKDGFLNLDVSPQSAADILHDLESFPYPFEDQAFERIDMEHVLEHLSDPFRTMAEMSRILRPGGTLMIRVPHFSRALTHPDHKRGFDVTFPLYFDPTFPGGYTGIPLAHKKTTLRWFSQKHLMRQVLPSATYYALTVIGAGIDVLANLSVMLCSRLWCFWVGGFYEIEFIFEKPSETRPET